MTKIIYLVLQLQWTKAPNETKMLLVSAIIAKSQDIGNEIVTNSSDSGASAL